MRGGVFTKEHCFVCGEKYAHRRNELICPEHQTRPRKFFIQLYSREFGKHIYIYSDSRGIPFSSYEQADRILTKIRAEIDAGTFDATRYVAQKVKPLYFSNWSKLWLEKKEAETQKGLTSPSYLRIVRLYVKKYEDFFGNKDIRDIGAKAVNDFFLSLNGAPHYIKNIMDLLKKMLRDAVDWEDIHQIPKFPKIEVPEPDISTIDLDLQDKIIRAIPDEWIEPLSYLRPGK